MTPPMIRTLWVVTLATALYVGGMAVFDLWTYRRHGNASTISFVLSELARSWPIVAFGLGFVTTMLAVHFFLPVTDPSRRRDLTALFAYVVGSAMGGLAAYLYWRQGRGEPEQPGGDHDAP